MVIGFGTPRSGTTSLAHYLNVTHEFKTIDNLLLSETEYDYWLGELKKVSKITGHELGDVSYDHINNLDLWINKNVTRICLLRNQDAFVESFQRRGPVRALMRTHPQHDFLTEDGLRRYWDWFYTQIFKHEDKFYIIGTESLPVWINKYGKQAENNR